MHASLVILMASIAVISSTATAESLEEMNARFNAQIEQLAKRDRANAQNENSEINEQSDYSYGGYYEDIESEPQDDMEQDEKLSTSDANNQRMYPPQEYQEMLRYEEMKRKQEEERRQKAERIREENRKREEQQAAALAQRNAIVESQKAALRSKVDEINAALPCRVKILNGPAMGVMINVTLDDVLIGPDDAILIEVLNKKKWDLSDINDTASLSDQIKLDPFRCNTYRNICQGYTFLKNHPVELRLPRKDGLVVVQTTVELSDNRMIETMLVTDPKYLSCRHK